MILWWAPEKKWVMVIHISNTNRRLETLKLNPNNGRMTLHILLDIPSVEVCTSGGDYIIKGRNYLKLGEKSPMEIHAEGGDVKFTRLEIYPLKSIH